MNIAVKNFLMIQEGHFYRDGYGNILGPAERNETPSAAYPWILNGKSYTSTGNRTVDKQSGDDLVMDIGR